MKKILDFLDKHKDFIKRLIVFFVAYLAISVADNSQILQYFNLLFGDFFGNTVQAAVTTLFITMEV